MDLLTVSTVLGAVETAASGALTGAAGEMGRRGTEALARVLRRTGGRAPALPVTEEERRRAAAAILDRARSDPDYAGEVAEWVREMGLLARRAEPVWHAPRALPPATAVFTDRDFVLPEITALLDRGAPTGTAPVVVLAGPGGIGKTATAVHTAHRLKERFPDGQLYVDLAGRSAASALSPSEALARLLGALGPADAAIPGDEHRQQGRYRELLADRRVIVVLDNAHTEHQVRPLIPAAPGALVLVTSRYRLEGLAADPGAHVITLGPLSVADSALLLERIAGPGAVRRQEPVSVRAGVAERCGGVPLALCATGSRVALRDHLSWAAVARQLAADGARDHGEAGGPAAGPDAVRRSQDAAYRELPPEARRLYRLLGAWHWPAVTVAAAARAADVPEARARRTLEELARAHLLEEVGEERYRFHDLVAEHAQRMARAEDGHAELAAAVRRVVVACLRFAADADVRVIPGRWRLGPAFRGLRPAPDRPADDGRTALAALRAERENLAAAVRAAETYGFDDLVWQLCEASWALHLRLGYHEQWIDTHLRGVAAARRVAAEFGDPRAVGRMLAQLAFGYLGRGQWAQAEQALAEAAEADAAAGHRRGQATAVESLGLLRLRELRPAEALDCFGQARRILAEIRPGEDGAPDVPRGLALLDDHIGRALRLEGRHEAAVARLLDALAQFRALPGGDLYNEGRVYMSLGDTHLAAGDPEAARVCLDDALAVMDREGAQAQKADAAEMRALCAARLGEPAATRADYLRTARELYEASGDGAAVARVRAKLAELGEP